MGIHLGMFHARVCLRRASDGRLPCHPCGGLGVEEEETATGEALGLLQWDGDQLRCIAKRLCETERFGAWNGAESWRSRAKDDRHWIRFAPFLTLNEGQEVCPRAVRNNVARKRLDKGPKGQMDLDGIFWYHPVVDGWRFWGCKLAVAMNIKHRGCSP